MYTPSKLSGRPHARVETDLRAKIQNGHWPIGTMLPGRAKLAKQYGVALGTLDRAVTRLLEEGLLRADAGRGTFVARSRPAASSPEEFPIRRPESDVFPGEYSRGLKKPATLGIVARLNTPAQMKLNMVEFYIPSVLQNLEATFSEAGGKTHFFNRARDEGDSIAMAQALDALVARGVDAIAVIDIHNDAGTAPAVMAELRDLTVPLVFISAGETCRPHWHVLYDNKSAGYNAARHVLEEGYTRLLFVAPYQASWVEERIEGVYEAIRDLGLAPETLRVFPLEQAARPLITGSKTRPFYDDTYDPQEDQRARLAVARAAFEALGDFDECYGIIAANDLTAFDVMEAARSFGWEAGRDYGLMGFDDEPAARSSGLTSMRRPLESLGRHAGQMLVRVLNGEESEGMQIRLRSHLIPRSSTNRSANLPLPPQAQEGNRQ